MKYSFFVFSFTLFYTVFTHEIIYALRYPSKQFHFLQRGFFDAYDRSGEKIFDTFIHGYCSSFSPPYVGDIKANWIQTNSWSYETPYILSYTGGGDSQHHPFWLWFWKKPRYWLNNALVKKDYFCQNSEIFAEVQLNGASEAGIFFRARGTYDFWALLLTRSKVILVRFYEGKRIELKTCTSHIVSKDWTLIKVSDQLADVVMWCGARSVVQEVTRELQDMDEISDQHMGAAGLVSFGGPAKFRNVHFGPVNWDTGEQNPPKIKNKVSITPQEETLETLEKTDLSNIVTPLTQWCPSPSHCATPPYRLPENVETLQLRNDHLIN